MTVCGLVPLVTLLCSLLTLSSSLSQSSLTPLTTSWDPQVPSLRNISHYPPCAFDEDCVPDHKCMQYMCYPWKTSTGFRWCSKDEDCEELTPREEGDGSNGLCFRHQDRDNIHFGICLKKIETKKCWTHGDCPRHLRCTNGYCGDRAYHEALKRRQCEDDSICEQLLTGEMCCYDLAGAKWWSEGKMRFEKKCCNNPSGHPVLRPTRHLDRHQMNMLDKGIAALAPMFLDTVICEGLDYAMMSALSSCQLYTTTSTTPDPSHRGLSSSAWSLVRACPGLIPLLLLSSKLFLVHQR